MNRPTLQQIEAFFWTATLGSVQKAADRLSLSQPAVSLRLKEFEANIGGPLFERSGRRLHPTQRTREVLRGARSVLDAVDGLSSAASVSIAGAVKVGFAEGFAMTYLPKIIDRLHSVYPDVHPELTVATSSSMEPALQDSRLDLAFLVEPREIEGFTYTYLGLQPTAWVASTAFDLPSTISPTALAKVRVISNQPGTIGYRQVVRWFASEGLQPAHLHLLQRRHPGKADRSGDGCRHSPDADDRGQHCSRTAEAAGKLPSGAARRDFSGPPVRVAHAGRPGAG